MKNYLLLLFCAISFTYANGQEPTMAAAEPTLNQADVISLFSGAYTDVAVDTWATSWSSAMLEDIQIEGNDTKKYTALDFVGIETVGPNLIDASAMTSFNFNLWTPNMTTFRVKLVDFGADGGFQGGDDTEFEIVFENPTQGEWITYQIPLTDFTGMNTNNIAQLIFSGLPAGGGTAYIDNVFFSNDATSVVSFQERNIDLFPNPVHAEFIIRSDKAVEEVKLYNALGELVLAKQGLGNLPRINVSNLANGMYVLMAKIDGETLVDRIIKN